MQAAAATGMAISNVTGVVRSPSSKSAAVLSTKPQLTHKPVQSAIGPRHQWPRRHHMLALNGAHTQMQSLILASFFSPIPDTRIRSSTEAKAPFCVRSSIIDWAIEGPMPESVCSSAALAVLMFTSPDEDPAPVSWRHRFRPRRPPQPLVAPPPSEHRSFGHL